MIRRIREPKDGKWEVESGKWKLVYNLLLPIGIPIYYFYSFLFRKKKLAPMKERLGKLSQEKLNLLVGKSPIWIQAVSVGEVGAVRSLIGMLRKEKPEIPIVLTTTTPKGLEIAKRLESEGVIARYFPLDIRWMMRRFIDQIHPRLFIMVETEFWPNCLAELSRQKIPMVVVNGRISDRSFPRYRMFSGWVKSILAPVSFFLVQTQEDQMRFKQIGVPEEKIQNAGNLKFDAVGIHDKKLPEPVVQSFRQGPVWVAASTHEPEEKELFQTYQKVKEKIPSLSWVIAPRHVERVPSLVDWFSRRGVIPVRWSRWRHEGSGQDWKGGILLVDTVGELNAFYAIANAVLVGGSFIPHGGQNPLEPAAAGKPVLFGPHVFNFREITRQLLAEGGAIQCRDVSKVAEHLTPLLQNPSQAKTIGEKAQAVVEKNRGATERTFLFLRQKNLL
ncbi:MAG: 3-deoxy-D-manno-octulosonic acid transferase [Candidatus Omnitrophica bacterium]|nr:3-deoxy-D-manno-octulosonic acid transferase [Candidatus Omnitrophota bacterium]